MWRGGAIGRLELNPVKDPANRVAVWTGFGCFLLCCFCLWLPFPMLPCGPIQDPADRFAARTGFECFGLFVVPQFPFPMWHGGPIVISESNPKSNRWLRRSDGIRMLFNSFCLHSVAFSNVSKSSDRPNEPSPVQDPAERLVARTQFGCFWMRSFAFG